MAVRRRTVEDVGLNPAFWNGRRVLVTGHTGFKGSWLCLWLQRLGADVAGFAPGAATDPGLFRLARVAESASWLRGDVRDGAALRSAFAEHRPEVVFHLAAQPLVRRSYRDPAATFEVNLMGTVNVLEAARKEPGVGAVVVVTTDKVYDQVEPGRAHVEPDRVGGRDPYSASKACAELATAAFRASFFEARGAPAVATARAGNVIGGGDWGEDRLVPDLLRAAAKHAPALIRNPDAVRPWQHVLNPLSGYLALAEALWHSPEHAGPWNFGPDDADARPVRWIVERLSALWGEEIPWRQDGTPAPHESPALRLDSTKAREQLGWTPRWDLEAALAGVVEWHRGALEGEDPRALVVAQIDDFSANAGASTLTR